MPGTMTLTVLITRDTTTNVITISITGPPPWVPLTGTAMFGPGFTAAGGSFTASGTGTVAGFSGTTAEFSGSVTTAEGLRGTLRIGTNGRLPTGQPITYRIAGRRQ
jgi:hypothetical protein